MCEFNWNLTDNYDISFVFVFFTLGSISLQIFLGGKLFERIPMEEGDAFAAF